MHEKWRPWRSYRDGGFNSKQFYSGAHRSRNQYTRVNVMTCSIDETIEYPKTASGNSMWIQVRGDVNEDINDEWWGFDKLEVIAIVANNDEDRRSNSRHVSRKRLS